jgi:hypothetical protein
MDIGQLLLATLIGGVVLFFWMGFTQNVLPWGIKSVKENPQLDALTADIKNATQDGVYYVHKDVAVFMAIKPGNYYNMGRYFGIEFATQLIVGAILAGILALTIEQTLETRLLLVALVGLAGVASIDLQYWNWWGFSHLYTLGVAVNRVVGYLLVGFIIANFILP